MEEATDPERAGEGKQEAIDHSMAEKEKTASEFSKEEAIEAKPDEEEKIGKPQQQVQGEEEEEEEEKNPKAVKEKEEADGKKEDSEGKKAGEEQNEENPDSSSFEVSKETLTQYEPGELKEYQPPENLRDR